MRQTVNQDGLFRHIPESVKRQVVDSPVSVIGALAPPMIVNMAPICVIEFIALINDRIIGASRLG